MLQCVAVSCNVLPCVAVCRSVSQCVAECCSVLQCVAVCCSVLCFNVLQKGNGSKTVGAPISMKVQEGGGVHENGGLCVLLFCSVFQLAQEGRWMRNSSCPHMHYSIKREEIYHTSGSLRRCVAVCGSVWQCVAVCCSVLQCVAGCCGVLRCVVVCCSELQCAAVCICVFCVHKQTATALGHFMCAARAG